MYFHIMESAWVRKRRMQSLNTLCYTHMILWLKLCISYFTYYTRSLLLFFHCDFIFTLIQAFWIGYCLFIFVFMQCIFLSSLPFCLFFFFVRKLFFNEQENMIQKKTNDFQKEKHSATNISNTRRHSPHFDVIQKWKWTARERKT